MTPGRRQRIALVTIVVRAYDEAIAWYREKLGFELIEDTSLEGNKRWVVMGPEGSNGPCLLLAQARGTAQEAASETRPADASFYSFTRTISGGITI